MNLELLFINFDTADIFAFLAILISVITFRLVYKKDIKNNISNETQKVYDEWFSIEFHHKRIAYNNVMNKKINFIKEQKGIREDEKLTRTEFSNYFKDKKHSFFTEFDDKERDIILYFIFWFDKVGWLVGGNLINNYYIIAPLQNWIMKVWQDNKTFISELRDKEYMDGKTSWHHSAGLEKLYLYCFENNHKEIVDKFFKSRIKN